MMDKRYYQPFCVLGKKRRFKGVRFGYLPPLEYPNGDDIEARMKRLEKRVNALEPAYRVFEDALIRVGHQEYLKRKKVTQ